MLKLHYEMQIVLSPKYKISVKDTEKISCAHQLKEPFNRMQYSGKY
jgi:translation initiation factor 2 alpha subunit (eIF-2alpha)